MVFPYLASLARLISPRTRLALVTDGTSG